MYIILCALMYFLQEKMIFHPEKLAKDYKYEFNQNFREWNIKTNDDDFLNGILFKADSSKGIVFYLHGNAGSLASWGNVAKIYTDKNYDCYMIDYPGFGKSSGKIKSQEQLFNAIQTAYDSLKFHYTESNIIILGYSIGTGPAAKIASINNPKLLILQAPYYSLTDMMKQNYPFVPTFLLKYKLETCEFVKTCKAPIVIFHGDKDEVIDYSASVRLKELLKANDKLITLPGQTHNGMGKNPEYLVELEKLLK
jgi:pimeloyl-ACP methyl ester carboxylesterase